MPDIDWSDIAIYLAVAEAGSLSAAARRLGTSQPTLGRRLAGLERQLGTTLFNRSVRGLTQTEAGAAILENARRMRDEAAAIALAAEGRDVGLRGPVTISAVEGLSQLWLAPNLRDFHDLYPDIHICVRVENQAADLVQREADIAIRMFRPVQHSLIARKVARVRFGIFAAERYIARHGSPRSADEIAGHSTVTWQPYTAQSILARGRCVFSSNSSQALLAATRSGLGLGVLAVSWAGRYPDLIRLLPDLDIGDVDMWLVTHEELRGSARIRALYDFLAERLAADAPIFAGDRAPRWQIVEREG